MRHLRLLLPAGDKRLLLIYVAICGFGLAILWSVTEPLRGPYETIDPGVMKTVFYRQVLWVLLAWAAMSVASRVPLRHLENLAWPLFGASLGLLLLVFVFGHAIGGSRRWLVLGPFRVQPSEVAKIAYIIVMASWLARHDRTRHRLLPTAASAVMTAVPFLLILREPDLGTSLVFPALWLGLVFWYGISGVFLFGAGSAILGAIISFYSESVAHEAWPWAVYLGCLLVVLYVRRFRFLESGIILAGNLVTGIGIPFVWERFKPYQQERILTFFDPARDAFGSGYQAIQSKVAIGSGGLFGTHYLQGTQKGLAFLPERHTDFIFSVVGEELGFVGAVALLAFFFGLIWWGMRTALRVRRPFYSFVAVGIVSYFTFHVVVNVGITTGLLPVTGLPLPLISYGGSNFIASSVLVGVLMNIDSRGFES